MNQIIRTSPELAGFSAALNTGSLDSMSIVVPLAATNLIENPTFTTTSGYTAYDADISSSYTVQRRGVSSLKVISTTFPGNGYVQYALTLTAGVVYTWSFDLYVYDGRTSSATVLDPSVATLRSITSSSNGYWKRYSITFTATTTGTYTLRLSVSGGSTLYTDGWMLIASTYESTYFDGSLQETFSDRPYYYWDSVENASSSSRASYCRSGGRIINFSELGLRTVAVLGVGGITKQLVTVPAAFAGSMYQRSLSQERQITIVVDILATDTQDLDNIYTILLQYFSNSIVYPDQPMTLYYTPLDSCGNELGETLVLSAYYEGGLESRPIVKQLSTRAAISLRVVTVHTLSRIGNNSTAMAMYTALAATKGLYVRGAGYTYTTCGSNPIYTLCQIPGSNYILIGGAFTTFEGVSGSIIRYARTTGVVSAISGAYTPSGIILGSAVIKGTTDALVVGTFTYSGCTNIAKVVGASSWSVVGTTGTNATVRCIVATSNPDILYIGGDFTTAGGVSCNHIAKYIVSTNTFVTVGTDGMNGAVYALAVDSSDNLYACGDFTTAGGVNANRVAKWDGTAWTALGTGIGTTGYVSSNMSMLVASSGDLYLGGHYTTVGGVTASGIARWNGSAWFALGTGLSGGSDICVFHLREIEGKLYVAGDFDNADVLEDCYGIAIWNGSTWERADIRFIGDAYCTYVDYDLYNSRILYYAGNGDSYDTVHVGVSATISNPGIMTHPTIILPIGTPYFIRNASTDKTVYFSGLTVVANEVVKLVITHDNLLLVSSIRGNISRYVMPNSALLFLSEGDNIIIAYGNTDISTNAYIVWQEVYQHAKLVVV